MAESSATVSVPLCHLARAPVAHLIAQGQTAPEGCSYSFEEKTRKEEPLIEIDETVS